MVSKCFFLLLLFPVLCCEATVNGQKCENIKDLTLEQKCATRDVLLGWMKVVNKPALRAEAVMRNVSVITQQALDLRKKAHIAINKYKKLRASLSSSGNNKAEIALIDGAITAASEAVAQTNESELKAKHAASEAEASETASTNYFNAVMRVARLVWRLSADGKWNYEKVKEQLDKCGNGCKKESNISETLDSNTANIDSMNLTQWKNKTLEVLQKTYKVIVSNKCNYSLILTKDDEKVRDVIKAVEDAVGRLEIAVHNLELFHAAVNNADSKLESASNVVEAANNSLLAFANGKVFCEIISRFSKSDMKLREVNKNVANEKQNAVNVVVSSDRVHEDVVAADGLVSDVTERLHSDHLTSISMLSGTHSLIATRSVAKASEAASKSVRDASDASKTASAIENEVRNQLDSLKRVQAQLGDMNAVTGKKISDATFDMCNNGLAEVLKNKSSEAIRHIAEFNMTLLSVLNKTLQEIGSTTGVIERNLSGVIRQVQEAKSNAQNASLLAKRATENVKEAIVEVLSGGVAELCAVLSKLRALHNEADAFSVHAAHAQANISEWLLRVGDAAGESDGFDDLTGSVEGAFATAGKRLEVLKRILYRADEQRGKVVGELAASVAVKESDKRSPQINKTLHDVLANVTSRVSADFSKDACNASLMSESLKLLDDMKNSHTVMNSLQVVAQLNWLTESMKERVLKAHNLMRMAAENSAQADAALEEAIRMARERSGKPQCPALYRQLLGALGLHW
ncbi:hypothetical protein TRVL_07762 [Trypanosoma vivax]|uniref:Uncharacterized protein n=1 Tax=Trypanosoma vivax (strain Y486) TaxID=1055687 RepID=F9WW22_TRYVY|nr:hypothetical protein TRVL_07762 [Trypanosoma vivax]CCD21789.1 hypothetical protein, conserved in T. vivax [Trypanosoma vivax Y486]|eukprot:CCD21789.1 hypothetical protein, conserved in T. vivax [Trypanosoma vivax Y486]